MRLLPRSLFGRMVLILVLGLLLTQLISAALMLRDRGQFLRHSSGLEMIQRIAGFVQLLERLPKAERMEMIRVLDSPVFRIDLLAKPTPPAPEMVPSPQLEAILSQALPDQREIRIFYIPRHAKPHPHDRPWRHPRPPERMSMRPPPRAAMGFLVSIQLSDGDWLEIQRLLPKEFGEWPGRLLGYLGLLLLGVILVSLLAVRLATRPLRQLALAADGLGKDINQPPMDAGGPAEVERAAHAFNTMQERLKRYIQDRDQMLGAVSHDLKTPLTRLRLRTELLDDPHLQEKFGTDLDDMEQMVTATIDYLRGTESKEQPVSLDPMALLELIQDDMQELQLKVSLEKRQVAPVTGRPLALKRCLGNLIENAARYGEEALVRLEDSPHQLVIVIADRGPAYSGPDLETLFQPFYRAEQSRSRETGGTGLGLGIARNIARAHGGDLILRKGSESGLEAVLTLPR